MEYSTSRLQWLFERYLNNTCTPEERNDFLEMVDNPQHQEEIKRLLEAAIETAVPDRRLEKEKADQLFATIMASSSQQAPVVSINTRRFSWQKIAVAASVIFLAGISLFLFFQSNRHQPETKTVSAAKQNHPILPGRDNAILTLSDGTKVVLDSASNGALANQGNTAIIKSGGQVRYTSKQKEQAAIYNTIATARGNQYQLILSDGTKVWLNAASSLQYPVSFTGNERRVSMTGEVYFEVAHNSASPFKVTVNGMEVTVLGTRFNVNSYTDEKGIKTTLLEGAVKVSKENEKAVLKPGQQATLTESGALRFANDVDVDEVVAWKNGSFIFNGQNVEAVMRQIGRWYDVDVIYKGPISKETFSGVVSRKSKLPDVLKILEDGGVKFKVENRKIFVMQ
jgi:transmembrane sensor